MGTGTSLDLTVEFSGKAVSRAITVKSGANQSVSVQI
jgi:hypothetical protein